MSYDEQDKKRLHRLQEIGAVKQHKSGMFEIDWERAAQDPEFAQMIETFGEIRALTEALSDLKIK